MHVNDKCKKWAGLPKADDEVRLYFLKSIFYFFLNFF